MTARKELYKDKYYKNRQERTLHSARTILGIILDAVPNVRSVVDFGCGVGTWLAVMREKGVDDIQGLDGAWVNQEFLEIPSERFKVADFTKDVALDRRYDLAITLEVAEHFPKTRASQFIHLLTTTSDFILFSAAIPHQGGRGHVNEQWLDYWEGLFKDQGFMGVDIVRRKIWNDQAIPDYYKQNIVLFVNKDRISDLELNVHPSTFPPISLVHPDLYLAKIAPMISEKGFWSTCYRTVKSWIKPMLKNDS